ncbi:hypothetical protein NX059_003474 [Plenodomus lindquistii]|nr:hypothetical protein NX059_003474 [Plenodomus lindquistii]
MADGALEADREVGLTSRSNQFGEAYGRHHPSDIGVARQPQRSSEGRSAYRKDYRDRSPRDSYLLFQDLTVVVGAQTTARENDPGNGDETTREIAVDTAPGTTAENGSARKIIEENNLKFVRKRTAGGVHDMKADHQSDDVALGAETVVLDPPTGSKHNNMSEQRSGNERVRQIGRNHHPR